MKKYNFINLQKEVIEPEKNEKPKNKKRSWFTIFIIIICICASILSANLISNLITVGTLTVTSKNTDKIYAISMGRYSTNTLATEKASEIQNQNGAGYVYQNNGIYFVLASGYASENDAIKVQTKLKEQKIDTEIVEVKVSITEVDTKNFTEDEKEIIDSAQKIFYETFSSLYDVAVSLDNGVIDEVKARVQVSSIKSNVEAIKSNFDSKITKKAVSDVLKLKLNLHYLNQSLSELLSNTNSFNSKIKYTYLYITQIC